MDCSTPGFLVLHYLPKFAQTHVHWDDDAIQPSHPLSPSSPPALNLSQHQGLFKWAAFRIRWPKYWRFSFNISPSNEHSGRIFYRMDWLDLLAVAQLCPTFCDPMDCSTPGLPITNSWSLLKLMSIESVMPSNHLILCHPFSSHLQSFPASGAFQMSQLFTSGDQSIGVSASASILPVNIQDWFPLGWTGWISLQSKGLSRVFSNTIVQEHQFFCTQLSL